MSLILGREKSMRKIKKLEFSDFDRIYEIMENSFPPDERRTYDDQKALLNNPKYTVYTFCEQDDILAFMAIWDLDSVAFIEHFAVRRDMRGRNIGSDMLSEIKKILFIPICLEVELPNNDIARRRIEFYKINGMFLNKYDYIQPSMARGREAVELMIMTSKGVIDWDEFQNIRNLLYTYVYDLSLPENENIKKLVHLN